MTDISHAINLRLLRFLRESLHITADVALSQQVCLQKIVPWESVNMFQQHFCRRHILRSSENFGTVESEISLKLCQHQPKTVDLQEGNFRLEPSITAGVMKLHNDGNKAKIQHLSSRWQMTKPWFIGMIERSDGQTIY